MVGISEFARKARLSEFTIFRIERGERCGRDTKRKTLQPWISCHWTLARFFMRTDLLGFYP
jgi:hypothetical protein